MRAHVFMDIEIEDYISNKKICFLNKTDEEVFRYKIRDYLTLKNFVNSDVIQKSIEVAGPLYYNICTTFEHFKVDIEQYQDELTKKCNNEKIK